MTKLITRPPELFTRGYGLSFNIEGVLLELTCRNESLGTELPDITRDDPMPTVMSMFFNVSLQSSAGVGKAGEGHMQAQARARIIEKLRDALPDALAETPSGADIAWSAKKGMARFNKIAETLSVMEQRYLETHAGSTWAASHNPAGLLIHKLMQDEELRLGDHLALHEIKKLQNALAPPFYGSGILHEMNVIWGGLKYGMDMAAARKNMSVEINHIVPDRLSSLLDHFQLAPEQKVLLLEKLTSLIHQHITASSPAR